MKHLLTYILLLFFITLAWSCVDEGTTDKLTPDEKDIRLHLRMRLPSENSLRSLNGDDAGDEIYIKTVNILAFIKNEEGVYHYAYPATNISNATTGSGLEITATVKEYPNEQVFLVFCNASDEIAEAGIHAKDRIDDAIARITCGSKTAGEWPAKINGSGDFKPFPMYARTSGQIVSELNNTIGDFPLARMVARADITLKSGVNDFVLVNARVYNRSVCGYVSYELSGWDSNTKKVTFAGVPSDNDFAGRPPILLPTVVFNANSENDSRGEIRRSIYLFESKGVSVQNRLKGTAIVVGGKYNGSDKVTYYRIDIKTDATPDGHVSQDILRNHWYQIEIQSVTGEGYENPDDAYIGNNMLTAKVTPWNLATQKVIADKQYQLKVSKDIIQLSAKGGSEEITTETNYNITTQGYPPGIQVDASEISYISGGDGWITLSGGNNGDLQRTICISAGPNNSGVTRKAKVKVKAGNLEKVIDIVQGFNLIVK